MSTHETMVALFDKWERVWHEGAIELVPSCLSETYVWHDERGDRTVTRDEYAVEIADMRQSRPGLRVVVFDHSFEGDRAWFRFAFQWNDPETGKAQTHAGTQSYRLADGKLVETWLSLKPLGSNWPGTPQEHWTSAPQIKSAYTRAVS